MNRRAALSGPGAASLAAPRMIGTQDAAAADTAPMNASISMNRIEQASGASARSSCLATGTVTSARCTAPEASGGRSGLVCGPALSDV